MVQKNVFIKKMDLSMEVSERNLERREGRMAGQKKCIQDKMAEGREEGRHFKLFGLIITSLLMLMPLCIFNNSINVLR